MPGLDPHGIRTTKMTYKDGGAKMFIEVFDKGKQSRMSSGGS
jgi:hypothetical protein